MKIGLENINLCDWIKSFKFYQNLTKTAFRKSRAKTELENS